MRAECSLYAVLTAGPLTWVIPWGCCRYWGDRANPPPPPERYCTYVIGWGGGFCVFVVVVVVGGGVVVGGVVVGYWSDSL